MALTFTLQSEVIEFPGGSLTVRGLSLPDVTKLVTVHREPITDLFNRYSGRDGEQITLGEASDIGFSLVMRAPVIAAHVIALAADAEDRMDTAGTLPVDVQVLALEKIAKLTFAMEGGPKKFVEMVVRIAKGMTETVKTLRA